jgi:hypothetical protein
MRCYDCNEVYQLKSGSIKISSNIVGKFEVHNVSFYRCPKCRKFLYPEETVDRIEKEENNCKDELLRALPIGDFVLSTEAAKILNISRQAFHKHNRIRRGFIYSIHFCGKKVYHKKSVLLFKEKGDGRFPLSKYEDKNNHKYIVISKPSQSENDFSWPRPGKKLNINPPNYGLSSKDTKDNYKWRTN